MPMPAGSALGLFPNPPPSWVYVAGRGMRLSNPEILDGTVISMKSMCSSPLSYFSVIRVVVWWYCYYYLYHHHHHHHLYHHTTITTTTTTEKI